MNQDFWPEATGQSISVETQSTIAFGDVFLLPFYATLLICSQFVDLIAYFGRQINTFFDKIYYEILVLIDRTNLSLRTKYFLMVSAGWLSTVFLTLILILAITAVWLVKTRENEAAQSVIVEKQNVIENDMRLTRLHAWPEIVAEATGEARVVLEEEKIIQLIALTEALTPAQEALLSQGEKLDIALLYYHLGKQDQYDKWIQQAWLMDPNAEYFIHE